MSVRARLSEAEVAGFIASHRGWHTERGELRRTFDFKTFQDSLRFVNEVAAMAERENHHPDIGLHYRRVTIALLTYDLDGVSVRDTDLAVKIDELRTRFEKNGS